MPIHVTPSVPHISVQIIHTVDHSEMANFLYKQINSTWYHEVHEILKLWIFWIKAGIVIVLFLCYEVHFPVCKIVIYCM
jgi:hypothetical protein